MPRPRPSLEDCRVPLRNCDGHQAERAETPFPRNPMLEAVASESGSRRGIGWDCARMWEACGGSEGECDTSPASGASKSCRAAGCATKSWRVREGCDTMLSPPASPRRLKLRPDRPSSSTRVQSHRTRP
eukprot:3090396-Rhodomonas_salina.1